jgi:SAM-dependent methyltransferase
MFSKLKTKLSQIIWLKNCYNLTKHNQDLVYKLEDINQDYYAKIKDLPYDELEHQIGRLTNYKAIISEIKANNLQGDIIEFGCWQGFSLLWLAYLTERQAIFDKKFIGIDGFGGLPAGEGGFKKGDFSNTSLKICLDNLLFSKDLYQFTKSNVRIIQALFSQKEKILTELKNIPSDKFCLIHIDSDISASLNEISDILKNGSFMADNCYVLFDDYGWNKEYAKGVEEWVNSLRSVWEITEHSHTKKTKNFKLKRK